MSARMQAAVLREPGVFEVRQVPLPPIGTDDVLIRVERCGICGTDVHIFRGHYAADALPMVPGHEFVGEIVDAIKEVSATAVSGSRAQVSGAS